MTETTDSARLWDIEVHHAFGGPVFRMETVSADEVDARMAELAASPHKPPYAKLVKVAHD